MFFLELEDVILINRIVVKQFGGLCKVRDFALLQSAILNPKNLLFYNNADIYEIASSYAIFIIKNHAFLDGNKRTGFASMNAFLELNGLILNFNEEDAVEMMVKVATSKVDLKLLTAWLKNL